MKMSTSPGGKKLKQARLTFGLAQPSPPKKAKLEVEEKPEAEPEPTPAQEVTIISDEEVQDEPEPVVAKTIDEKRLNPYVSMVDIALKRKLNRKVNSNGKIKHPPSPDNMQISKRAKIEGPESIDKEEDKSESEVDEDKSEVEEVEDKSEVEEVEDADKTSNSENEESADDEDKCNESMNDSVVVEDEKQESTDDKKDNEPKTPKSRKPSNRKLSSKQMQKKLELEKKQAQRELEKKMREKQKQLEKDEKNRLKQEREEQKKKEREEKEKLKEEERKQKEAVEELKRKAKEDKEQQKRLEKEAREEEKRKKEEEKQRREEELENRKKKTSVAFVNFFVPKEKLAKSKELDQSMDDSNHNYLSNFTIKSDMRLAPIVRLRLEEKNRLSLDSHLKKQDTKKSLLYLKSLKNKNYKSKTSSKTWPLEDLKNELIIIEDDLPPVDEDSQDNEVIIGDTHAKTSRPKLLLFSDNRRPPYWGTWSKKSYQVTGRRPFALDKTFLDYSCDSDDEWEEEEPGESVESVAGSDDEEDENEYDVDNEFMVPHGYLSDEELLGQDEILTPETQKAKLKYLEDEFEGEMKKTTKVKQPRLIGIFWQNDEGCRPTCCPVPVWEFLVQKMILSSEKEIEIQTVVESNVEVEDVEKKMKNPKKITDDMIPDLIKLIHGNTNNKAFLAKEFQSFVAKNYKSDDEDDKNVICVSKMSIAKKIREVSNWMPSPDEGPMHTKMCWFVDKETRDKYELDLKLPNEWSYTLMPKRWNVMMKDKILTANDNVMTTKKENAFNITKFTKKLTQEEREKQFVPTIATQSPCDPNKLVQESTDKKDKKRVPLLLSGPIGRDLPSTKAESPKIEKVDDKKELPVKNEKIVEKKKVPLSSSSIKPKDSSKPIRTNLLTQFIKTASVKYDKDEEKTQTEDCVVLSD